jgi:hypothetical protein
MKDKGETLVPGAQAPGFVFGFDARFNKRTAH